MLSLFIGKRKDLAKKIIKEANTLLTQINSAKTYDRETVFKRAEDYLKNDNWQIRNIGVKLLGIAGEKKHLHILAERLRDASEAGFVKRNAAVAMGKIGASHDGAKDALIASVDDKYWEIRAEAIKALSCIYKNDKKVFSVIVSRLLGKEYDEKEGCGPESLSRKREKNFEVKEAIAYAMGNFPHIGDSEEALKILLGDDNWIVRAAALNSLKKTGKISDSTKKFISNIDLTCESFTPVFPLKEIYTKLISKNEES